MRRIVVAALIACVACLAYAQTESTAPDAQPATDSAASAGVPAPDATVAAPSSGSPAPETPAPDSSSPAPAATPAASPDAAAPAAAPDAAAPAAVPDAAAPEAPAAETPAAEVPAAQAEALAEVERLSARLEEANATIDGLRAESDDLKAKLRDAEDRAKAAESRSGAAAADSDALRSRQSELDARVKALEAERDALYAKLASFGGLKIDAARYPELLRSGFDGSKTRLGSWKLADGVLSQSDPRQFFSRLSFPLVQSSKPLLYSFETRTGKKGWVGTGIHLFSEGIKKPRGYGEGTSLLVWLTRDAKIRGNDGTYLQVYRSDDDVNMERVLDAKVGDRLDAWNRIEVLYEPDEEFIVIAVNGSVRAAYRTYFGIGSGVTMSLRTLGAGVQFRNLEVRR